MAEPRRRPRVGERADCTAHLTAAGVLVERQGTGSIFIPAAQLVDARLEPALAGKVVGRGGLLVLRWQLGNALLDTGVRGDDRRQYAQWVQAISHQKQETEAS